VSRGGGQKDEDIHFGGMNMLKTSRACAVVAEVGIRFTQ